MPTVLGTLAVRLKADSVRFEKSMSKASKSLESFAAKSRKASKISAAGFAVAGASLALVTAAASKQLNAERRLSAAFRATGKAIDLPSFKRFASGLQNITLTGDETTLAMGAMLAPFGLMQDQIESLIPSVLDLSAATGQSAEGITLALGRAISGGTVGALSRYGIALGDAEKKTFQFGAESERVALLVRKLAVFQGQAAAEASTAAGRFTQAKNSFGDVTEEIGKLIDQPLAGFFVSVKDSLNNVAARISALPAPVKNIAANFLLWGTAALGLTAAVTGLVSVLPAVLMFAGVAGKAFVALSISIKASSLAAIKLVAVFGAVAAVAATAMGAIGLLMDLKSNPEVFFEKLREAGGQEGATGISGLIENMIAAGKASFKEGMDPLLGVIKDTFNEFAGAMDVSGDVLENDLPKKINDAIGKIGELGTAAKETAEQVSARMTRQGTAFDFGTLPISAGLPEGIEVGDGPSFDFAEIGEETAASIAVSMDDVGNTIQEKVEELGPPMGEQIANAAANFGDSMLSAAGDAGSFISDTIEGFQSGGIIGGIVNAIGNLVMRSEAFKESVAGLNEVFADVVDAIEPLAEGMKPLANLTHVLISIIADVLTPVFKLLGWVLKALFGVLKVVSLIIVTIVLAIGSIWNAIIGAIARVFKAIGDFLTSKFGGNIFRKIAKAHRRMLIPMGGVEDAMDKLKGATLDAGAAMGKEGGGGGSGIGARSRDMDDLGDSMSDLGDTVDDLNEKLTNVPTGFKAASARFRATDLDSPASVASASSAIGGGNTFIFNVHDAKEAMARMQDIEGFENMREKGNPGSGGPFSSSRGGA